MVVNENNYQVLTEFHISTLETTRQVIFQFNNIS